MEGNKVVCHTAEWLEVEVRRDGNIYHQRFESSDEGAEAVTPVTSEKDPTTPQKTGTIITYKPDPRVYGDIFIDLAELRRLLQEMSYFTKGLRIELFVDGEKEVFYSENGLVDGLTSENAIGAPFSFNYETNDCKVELALQWVSKGGTIKGYANGLFMPDGGNFISQFRSSLTRTFNSLAKAKFDGDMIRRNLNGFVSVKVRVGQFSNQAKTSLANKEAGTATAAAITECLKRYEKEEKTTFAKVVEVLERQTKAEAAADKARQQVLNMQKSIDKASKAKILEDSKLEDARIRGENSILVVVEGESAGGSIAMGRGENVGILKLLGKMLNLEVASEDEWTKNKEVQLLQQALGIVYGKPYNPSNLRYGKIAIASDGDADGSHIAMLVAINLWNICPELIKDNRLYRLEAPLYKVHTQSKDYFYYSEQEFINHAKGEIIRFKGLGQMEPEDLKNSMFSPEFQRLTPWEYSENGINLLKSLMGKDVSPKKNFVFSNVDFKNLIIE